VFLNQITACCCNHQFVVLTKVIDKKTLNAIFVAVVSFFSTIVPVVLALLPDPGGDATGHRAACALTPMQASLIRSAANLALGNDTDADACSYNISLATIINSGN
jgi:hypothetical protein